MQKVGFIGLGNMGLPMARNLSNAGVALLVWNRTRRTLADFGERGDVTIAASARDVLRQTRTSILMLLNQSVVDTILERGTAAFEVNVKGKCIIAMGSVDPIYSIALSMDISAAGGTYLEAPVSGSRIPAEQGQLVCLLGGPKSVAKSVEPILRPMCKEQIYCGDVGDALRMKLAINLYLCSSLVALAEATNFARLAGVSLNKFQEAISRGPLSSDFAQIKLSKLIARDFALQAGLADAHASTCLIQAEAMRLSAATPQLDLGSELYANALAIHGPDVDMASVIDVFQSRPKTVGQQAVQIDTHAF